MHRIHGCRKQILVVVAVFYSAGFSMGNKAYIGTGYTRSYYHYGYANDFGNMIRQQMFGHKKQISLEKAGAMQ